MPVVFQPAQLAGIRDVATQAVAALTVPRRPFRPQDRLAVDVAMPQAMDCRVALGDVAERRVNCNYVRIAEVRARRAVRAEVAWWIGGGRRGGGRTGTTRRVPNTLVGRRCEGPGRPNRDGAGHSRDCFDQRSPGHLAVREYADSVS